MIMVMHYFKNILHQQLDLVLVTMIVKLMKNHHHLLHHLQLQQHHQVQLQLQLQLQLQQLIIRYFC